MGWKDLVEPVAGDGEDVIETKWRCLCCGREIQTSGAMSQHIEKVHERELEASRQGWTPDGPQDVEDVLDDDRRDPPAEETSTTDEDTDQAPGDLADLEDRGPERQIETSQPQETSWKLPGGKGNDDERSRDRDTDGVDDADDADRDDEPDPDSGGDVDDVDQDDEADDEDQAPVATPEEFAPMVESTFRVVSNRLEEKGASPISDREMDMLVQTWSPVMAKWMPVYNTEISALWATALIVGPKIAEARQAQQEDDEDVEDQVEEQTPPTYQGGDQATTSTEEGFSQEEKEAFLAQVKG